MEPQVKQKDIRKRITLLIKVILIFLIPYVRPIPRESILTDNAKNKQLKIILYHLIWI